MQIFPYRSPRPKQSSLVVTQSTFTPKNLHTLPSYNPEGRTRSGKTPLLVAAPGNQSWRPLQTLPLGTQLILLHTHIAALEI